MSSGRWAFWWRMAAWLAVGACAGGAPRPVDTTSLPSADRTPSLDLEVDEKAHEISVRMGPFMPSAMPHGDHGASMEGASSPLMRFEWPVDGWMRGFRVRLVDAQGHALPRAILHHVIGVNFDRRQLVYPALERFIGVGSETGDVELPKELGVPMAEGEQLGLYASLHDATGRVPPVHVLVTIAYTPRESGADVKDVLPIYLDTNHHIAATNAWDLPPGRSQRAWEFSVPVSGGLLGVSGHLHAHGQELRLEDAASNEVLVELQARRDREGNVEAVETHAFRKWLGLRWDPLRLEAGRAYRVVGIYDSPLADTVPDGAMAHIVGVFEPDDMGDWPALDMSNDTLLADLRALPDGPGEPASPDSSQDGHVH